MEEELLLSPHYIYVRLAPRPSFFLVNAIVRDTLPRTGLLFAHKTQRTHPGGEGDGGGRAKTARQVHHASGTHTQQAPPSRPHQGEGDAHLHGKCTTRQAHTQGPTKRP